MGVDMVLGIGAAMLVWIAFRFGQWTMARVYEKQRAADKAYWERELKKLLEQNSAMQVTVDSAKAELAQIQERYSNGH